MLARVQQLYNTVKYLKLKQVRYQLQYRLIKPGTLAKYNKNYEEEEIAFLSFSQMPPVFRTANSTGVFSFLNLQESFNDSVDWGYSKHGKLWNYNLQYCNYLLQEDISLTRRVDWIRSLYDWLEKGKLALEPYPVSLRSINVIRLASSQKLKTKDIIGPLHAELDFLYQRPEYHLLGNHLLENAFALIMGGAFFTNDAWISKGEEILRTELEEQILADGAHFELSPMYHQIILFRLLELLDWYSNWSARDVQFENFLKEKSELMVSWLKNMTFLNGDIPHFNDSAPGIAFSSNFLLNYAEKLNVIPAEDQKLGTSGYRKFTSDKYECIVDAAEIGPSYQPGHGHADALSFIMYVDMKALFVEWGTSTYQPNERRSLERSTAAHNTLVVDNKNQSKVWGAFRVANRARVKIERDEKRFLKASHDGYNKYGLTHTRAFSFEDSITITDVVEGRRANAEKLVYFHIHPDREVQQTEQSILIDNVIKMNFDGAVEVITKAYSFAEGYNIYKPGISVVVRIQDELTTTISFI